jgi:hypothetical protein
MKRILLSIFSCVILSSCNSSSNKKDDTSIKHDYPAYIIKSFIDGCTEENPNPDISQTMICSCIIEKIQTKYTLEEYNEISKSQNGTKWDEYQQFLYKAAEECIKNNTTK